MLINALPDVISSKLIIYADGAIIYSCLGSKFNSFKKVNLATTLEKDLQLWVNGGIKWLVNLNA